MHTCKMSGFIYMCECIYTCRGSVNVPVKDIRAGLSVSCWMAQGGSPPHTVLSEPQRSCQNRQGQLWVAEAFNVGTGACPEWLLSSQELLVDL